MNSKQSEFLRKCQLILLLACGTVPIGISMFALILPEYNLWYWVFPGCYVLLTAVAVLLPKKRRMLFSLFAICVLFAAAVPFLTVHGQFSFLAVPLLYSLLLLCSIPLVRKSAEREIPFTCYSVGIILHVLAQVALLFTNSVFYSRLQPTGTGLVITFFAYAFLAMFSANRKCLSSASIGQQKAPKTMEIKNKVMIGIIAGIAFVLTLIPQVIAGVRFLIEKLWNLLQLVFALLGKLFPQIIYNTEKENVVPEQTLTPTVVEDPPEPTFWDFLINCFLILLAVAASAALLFLVGRGIYLLFRFLFRRIKRLLTRYIAAVNEDYEDEITDTREIGVAEHSRARHVREEKTDLSKQTPREQIRYHYRRLLKKHPEWSKSRTPRQTLPDSAASVYERVRYSDHPVDESDVASFTADTKRLPR